MCSSETKPHPTRPTRTFAIVPLPFRVLFAPTGTLSSRTSVRKRPPAQRWAPRTSRTRGHFHAELSGHPRGANPPNLLRRSRRRRADGRTEKAARIRKPRSSFGALNRCRECDIERPGPVRGKDHRGSDYYAWRRLAGNNGQKAKRHQTVGHPESVLANRNRGWRETGSGHVLSSDPAGG